MNLFCFVLFGFHFDFDYLNLVSFSKCFMKLSLAVWWSTMVTLWLWYECKTAIFTSTSVLSFHNDVGVRVSKSNFRAIFYNNFQFNSSIQLNWMGQCIADIQTKCKSEYNCTRFHWKWFNQMVCVQLCHWYFGLVLIFFSPDFVMRIPIPFEMLKNGHRQLL